MAYRNLHIADFPLWSKPQSEIALPLGQRIEQLFARQRPHLNDIIDFSGHPPHDAMTLAEWSQPARLASLLASYQDHIYHKHPERAVEQKALKSLWVQWYVGLVVPPLMLALLCQPQAIDLDPQRLHTQFHESGRVAKFWMDAREDRHLTMVPLAHRLDNLWRDVVQPVVNALEQTGDISGKLIWSNTGYLVGWFLTEIKPLIGEEQCQALRQACFFERTLVNGEDNPLFRTMIVRNGLLARRTCCQRNKLPGVQQCGDCTLS